jgi:hypothetical protein
MTNPNINNISMKSIDFNFEMVLFRDRFDLADLLSKPNVIPSPKIADPVKLISLMTWRRDPLDLNDCKEVLRHFKTIDSMLLLSEDAIEFSIQSLNISDRSKRDIITFFKTDDDLYID